MATKIFMEALSPTMEEGRLVKWNKNEGDAVKSGDSLAEVETDKAIMELVARGDGILRKRLVGENESRPVGTLFGVIGTADEDIASIVAAVGAAAPAAPAPAAAPNTPTEKPAAAQPAPVPTPPAAQPAAGPQQPASAQKPAAAPGAVIRSSPLARRMANERGVELSAVAGSGPGGRITRPQLQRV